MKSPETFSYTTSFVTVVLALAVSDMIQSAHRMLRARRDIVWHAVPLLAALYVFLLVMLEFFWLWGASRFAQVDFFGVAGLLVVPTLIALAAHACLPDEVLDKPLRLFDWYAANRRYLYAVLLLASACAFAREAIFDRVVLGHFTSAIAHLFLPHFAFTFATLVLLWWSANRWLHLAGLVWLFVLLYVFVASSSIG